MRIGAHVDPTDPLDAAVVRKAEAVQFFLTDPQGYKTPKPRADAEQLRAAEVDVYIHRRTS
jgi:deoxyribonuclease IV